eukprot:CAMPEP_0194333940 /NCGR_PEP_ID=MMETSP0171-20130528/64427_1 /TAXON_ID=218684 /ORGANISM="Corethron pennatum, Strain L29A3" /LENGTH=223 /DNA_ID=CAMNT_0039096375 /DNA_START=16 /DNA_END=684 /DNA_ORIENTATION=-
MPKCSTQPLSSSSSPRPIKFPLIGPLPFLRSLTSAPLSLRVRADNGGKDWAEKKKSESDGCNDGEHDEKKICKDDITHDARLAHGPGSVHVLRILHGQFISAMASTLADVTRDENASKESSSSFRLINGCHVVEALRRIGWHDVPVLSSSLIGGAVGASTEMTTVGELTGRASSEAAPAAGRRKKRRKTEKEQLEEEKEQERLLALSAQKMREKGGGTDSDRW